jgi:hypothetical protein
MKLKKLAILSALTFMLFSCKTEVKKDGQEIVEDSIIESEVKQVLEESVSQSIDFTNGNITTESITLKDITVSIVQKTPPQDNYDFSCHSKIISTKNNKTVDSLIFKYMEAVGGSYGLTSPIIINNHIILTKHGDYDGRTIVINENGQIFNIIGGENYIDEEAELLFTIFDSDLSGYAVFDLKSDSLMTSIDEIEDRTRSIHKEYGNRYFMNCFNDETNQNTIWEFEFDLDRTMQVDLDSNDINSSNQLKRIELNDANCICKKE